MSKSFKSLVSITPVTVIDSLIYGVGKDGHGYYVYLKKPRQQWVKRHGPFGNPAYAESQIKQIEDEYNAVRSKQEERTRSQTKTPFI